jgi:hypothetical protein
MPDTRLAGQLRQARGFLRRKRERPFHQHVLARPQGRLGQLAVERDLDRDDHQVDVGMVGQFLSIGEPVRRPEPFRRLACALGPAGGDRRELVLRQRPQGGYVGSDRPSSVGAGTDDADSDHHALLSYKRTHPVRLDHRANGRDKSTCG